MAPIADKLHFFFFNRDYLQCVQTGTFYELAYQTSLLQGFLKQCDCDKYLLFYKQSPHGTTRLLL
jgi:hypothetical protein